MDMWECISTHYSKYLIGYSDNLFPFIVLWMTRRKRSNQLSIQGGNMLSQLSLEQFLENLALRCYSPVEVNAFKRWYQSSYDSETSASEKYLADWNRFLDNFLHWRDSNA